MKRPAATSWPNTLTRSFVTVHGSRVAVYAAPDNGKPTALLVHGFSGTYGGMTFLSEELRDDFRVVLIDLPCHGASDAVACRTRDELAAYMRAAAGTVSRWFGPIHWLIGHSMGTGVAAMMQPALPGARVALICPVPTPSGAYAASMHLMQRSRAMRWLQGTQLLAIPRGMAILRHWRGGGFGRMCVNSWRYGGVSRQQLVERAGLPSLILTPEQFRGAAIDLVIAGRSDTTAKERTSAALQAAFPSASVQLLPGGHLLPIESPSAVAAIIRQHSAILNT